MLDPLLPRARHLTDEVARGNAEGDELATAPWHVVGDLDDLRPDPDRDAGSGTGVDPDAVPEAEVLEVAVAFIAAELQARAAPAAVSSPPPPAVRVGGPRGPEPSSRTAVRRVLSRLARWRWPRRLRARRKPPHAPPAGAAGEGQRGTSAQ